jgi:hypothetical protein
VGCFLDGIRVPALFHLLAGPAVVPPALIDRVELHPGGYPAQYGRFAGAVVTSETRAPSDTFRAEGSLRLVDAGALVEAPLPGDRGSALAAGRYSYAGPIISLFAPDVRVDYWDYQARLALNLGPHDKLTLFAFGSRDNFSTRLSGEWVPQLVSEFHRVDLRWDSEIGERTRLQNALTFGVDRSVGSFTFWDAGTLRPVARDTSFSARTRVLHRLSDAILVRAGADASYDAYTLENVAGVIGVVPLVSDLFHTREDLAVGLHADAVIAAGRGVELTPGLRVDLWGSRGATAMSVDPRLSVKVPVGARVRLLDAVGLAHQAPGFAVAVPGVAIAGLRGGLQRSFQVSSGVEVDLPLAITASTTFFYDAFFQLSDPMGLTGSAGTSTNANSMSFAENRAQGSSIGMEVYLRRKLTERLGGYLAYTLSRSSRSLGRQSFAAQFDRTHVLGGALSWDIGRGFRAGARASFYTGMPLDPFYPAAQVAAVGMKRMPPFFRLDARAEKRWVVGKRGWVSLVLEVLNATASKEPNGLSCLMWPDVGCEVTRLGPVVVPSLGIEGGI